MHILQGEAQKKRALAHVSVDGCYRPDSEAVRLIT